MLRPKGQDEDRGLTKENNDFLAHSYFAVKDEASFDQLWSDEGIRKVFTEKQIQRTMWPIFRPQVLDGTTRLGIPAVVLLWLM